MKRTRLSRKGKARKQFRIPRFDNIELIRWEGRTEECMKPEIVKTFAEADAVLDRWRTTAPDYKGGYDKIGFKLFSKGKLVYTGRYDLNKANDIGYADAPSLEQHIIGFRKWKSMSHAAHVRSRR